MNPFCNIASFIVLDGDAATASTPIQKETAYDRTSETNTSVALLSGDTYSVDIVDEIDTSNVNVAKISKQRVAFQKPPAREKYKEKLIKEVTEELSHDKLHKLVIRSIREGTYKQNIIPIDIWDFGGQKDYYMTHQLFITSRGIFVVVFNGSLDLHKHLPDLAFLPGHFGKSSIAGNQNNILSYSFYMFDTCSK